MEEKTLAQGNVKKKVKTIFVVLAVIFAAITLFMLLYPSVFHSHHDSLQKEVEKYYDEMQEIGWGFDRRAERNAVEVKFDAAVAKRDAYYSWRHDFSETLEEKHLWIISACITAFFFVSFFFISKMQIVVTDKRVYGQAGFGKRVDLPIDSISAVASSALSGIAVATSSGKISFLGIENNDRIRAAIAQLLLERQKKEKDKPQPIIKQEVPQSNADELKKYKELLDAGVITQEEFDAKKKQLLGL